jgi:signal transduction histidine kinase
MPSQRSTRGVLIEELRVALEETREAVAARDAFIATAIHELLNPMTPIAAQVGRLRAGRPRPRKPKHAAMRSETAV